MKKPLVILSLLGLITIAVSCKKDKKDEDGITDQTMFNYLMESGHTYYKNSTDTLTGTTGAHASFVRVRFNSTAKAALGGDGKLPAGGSFPEGSVVVKEIYAKKGGALTAVAVMLKKPSSNLAGNGWIWGEYKADGSNIVGIDGKGGSCIGCHSSNTNRDLVDVFDAIP